MIDIQVSVPDQSDEDAYVPALRRLGMKLRSRDRDRRYLRPAAGSPRAVQFHVCDVGSQWERDHLLFRDYLRSMPAARDTYDRAKREVAATGPTTGSPMPRPRLVSSSTFSKMPRSGHAAPPGRSDPGVAAVKPGHRGAEARVLAPAGGPALRLVLPTVR